MLGMLRLRDTAADPPTRAAFDESYDFVLKSLSSALAPSSTVAVVAKHGAGARD
jgi:hypothetical protein